MDISNYKPDQYVLSRLNGVDFVAVIGPTAAGKTTLLDAVIARYPKRVHMVTVTTSRPKRPGEQSEIDYHFRSKSEIRERIAKREFVQVAPTVLDDLYATAPEDYLEEGTAVMAVIADAMPVFTTLPFKRFRQVFILPPNWESWQERVAAHQFSAEQRAKRMAEARRSFQYALNTEGLDFVINDTLPVAADRLGEYLVTGSNLYSASRAEGRALAKQLLKRLEDSTR